MRQKLLFIVLLFPVCLAAQRTANVGLATGVVNYIGDLGNEKKFPVSSVAPGMQITIRDFLNNPERSSALHKPLSMELRLSWHRLQYDETESLNGKEGMELRNYFRGINFRNDLFGTSLNFTYTFYRNRIQPLHKQGLVFYLLAGAGIYYGKPKADLFNGDINLANRYYHWSDGSIHDVSQASGVQGKTIQKDGIYETDLPQWKTEGEGVITESQRHPKYHTLNYGFPFGAGIRYGLNRDITFSAEFNYYYFLTDYLDDVSGRYATYEELAVAFPDPQNFEIAKYISDPSGKGTDGTEGLHTSRRGNPALNDSFTFFSIEISYHITIKPKGIYGQTARR